MPGLFREGWLGVDPRACKKLISFPTRLRSNEASS
jgi:hypothetical protein